MKGEYFGATCDTCGGPGIAQSLDWVGPNVHSNEAVCRHYLEKKRHESQECNSETEHVERDKK
jgi:hypothetical protein